MSARRGLFIDNLVFPRGNSNARLQPCGHLTAEGSSETLAFPTYTLYSTKQHSRIAQEIEGVDSF